MRDNNMKEPRLKILAPWAIYIKKLEALFGKDPEITCTTDFSGTAPNIVLACDNGDKVAALQHILPTEVDYGNVTLKVTIDGAPADRAFVTKKELFEVAFNGNPIFKYAVCPSEEGAWWIPVTYVVFEKCVVQFYSDNLNDCHGMLSTLYEDIAEDVLAGDGVDGVYFNTDVDPQMPLGEWP